MGFKIVESSSTEVFESQYPLIRRDIKNGDLVKDVRARYGISEGQWLKYRRELISEGLLKSGKERARGKHYYYNSLAKKYRVYKTVNGKKMFFGQYKTEEEAKYVVKRLKECNWDKTQLRRIQYDVLE